jgi:hypothetical protein
MSLAHGVLALVMCGTFACGSRTPINAPRDAATALDGARDGASPIDGSIDRALRDGTDGPGDTGPDAPLPDGGLCGLSPEEACAWACAPRRPFPSCRWNVPPPCDPVYGWYCGGCEYQCPNGPPGCAAGCTSPPYESYCVNSPNGVRYVFHDDGVCVDGQCYYAPTSADPCPFGWCYDSQYCLSHPDGGY